MTRAQSQILEGPDIFWNIAFLEITIGKQISRKKDKTLEKGTKLQKKGTNFRKKEQNSRKKEEKLKTQGRPDIPCTRVWYEELQYRIDISI